MSASFEHENGDDGTSSAVRKLSRAAEYSPVFVFILAGVASAVEGWPLNLLLTTAAITLVCVAGSGYVRSRRTGRTAFFGTVAVERRTDQWTREFVDWGVLIIISCALLAAGGLLVLAVVSRVM